MLSPFANMPLHIAIKAKKAPPLRDPQLLPVAEIQLDRIIFTVTKNDVTRFTPYYPKLIGFPLADLRRIQPGVVTGLRKPVPIRPSFPAFNGLTEVLVDNGPAVWLHFNGDDFLLPSDQPEQLARELERRRHHAVSRNGFLSWVIERRFPELFEVVDGVRQPAAPSPQAPTSPEHVVGQGKWRALPPPSRPCPQELPPIADRASVPVEAVSSVWLPNLAWPLDGTPCGLHLALRDGDLTLRTDERVPPPAWKPGARKKRFRELGVEDVIVSMPVPDHLHAPAGELIELPLLLFPHVEVGEITGLSVPVRSGTISHESNIEVSFDLVNGPALWLWGPYGEWVFNTPDAPLIAKEIRARQGSYASFPRRRLRRDVPDGPDRSVWLRFPDLEPVSFPGGGSAFPAKPFVPAQPTLLPTATWRPCD